MLDKKLRLEFVQYDLTRINIFERVREKSLTL